jgi:hypothetical protein
MRYPELERYRSQYPELSKHFEALGEYLTRIEKYPPDDSRRAIIPAQLAQALRINEVTALALLYTGYQAGILVPRYRVYCEESSQFMAEFDSLEEIPPKILCPFHGVEHNDEGYFKELVFVPSREPESIEKQYQRPLASIA